ncbi:unnamed protein product [Effrenium voratum]|nr:unnamed protein product [Effrenium voratum]
MWKVLILAGAIAEDCFESFEEDAGLHQFSVGLPNTDEDLFRYYAMQCVHNGGHFLLYRSSLRSTLKLAEQGYWAAVLQSLEQMSAEEIYRLENLGICAPRHCSEEEELGLGWRFLARNVLPELQELTNHGGTILERLTTQLEVETSSATELLKTASSGWMSGRGSPERCFQQVINSCDFQRSPLEPANPPGRLAIAVVGLLARLADPASIMEKVVAPAVAKGMDVDFYVCLGLTLPFFHSWWQNPLPNPAMVNASLEEVRDQLVTQARSFGVRHAVVTFLPNDIEVRKPSRPGPYLGRRWDGTLRGFLRVRQQMELLWNFSIEPFTSVGGSYSHVMYILEDYSMVDEVDLSLFPDPWTVYSPRFGVLCDAYRDRANLARPINTMMIVGGEVAKTLLSSVYTQFYADDKQDLVATAQSVEHYVQLHAEANGVSWAFVPQNWLPGMRVTFTLPEPDGTPVPCYKAGNAETARRARDQCVDLSKLKYAFCEDLRNKQLELSS